MQNWDQLHYQVDTTLNLLCPSRFNLRLSAYAHLNGEFEHPMSPPGIITLVNDNPHDIVIWAPQVHEVCYVRPSMIHYFCLKSYIPRTAKEQVSDTTEFFPETLPLPRISSEYAETHVVDDLAHSLLSPTPTSPLTTLVNNHTAALKQLAEILNMAAPP